MDFKLISNEDSITKKISGIINNNRIIYIDDNIKTTIVLDDVISMKRESEEYIIEFIFDKKSKTKGTYKLLKHNISLDLEIDTLNIVNNKGLLVLEYHLLLSDEDKGIYKLELKY